MRYAIAILALCAAAYADQWSWFHPEAVTGVSCKVEVVDFVDHGPSTDLQHPSHSESYVAEASAKRNDASLGDWAATLGRFPVTDKGLDQANKACMKWVHEAGKRIRAAK